MTKLHKRVHWADKRWEEKDAQAQRRMEDGVGSFHADLFPCHRCANYSETQLRLVDPFDDRVDPLL